MTATLTRPNWTTDHEIELFDKLIDKYAPHLPKTRAGEPRPPANEAEWSNFYRYRIAGAAHDLFIVQLAAKAIDRVIDEPEWQLLLSRQIGDDGAHSAATRQRIWELSGQDPTEEIKQQVQWHWDYLGDLPLRNWLGFIAWELHYELHIVAILLLSSRLTQINEPESGKFATERILPDEFVHRVGVVEWWQQKYDRATPTEKSKLSAQLLQLDEELQRRRNPYLRDFWQRAHRALGFESKGFDVIYDAWRREVLAYFLNIPVAHLPKLVSINN
ncbi:MAG: hypothetical protein JOZ78_20975 [Chroococcidiopsidaceae cyanobacterium CP_BM_ER_R8_30]|nr:hypothetical protein [Chroococcidiopsidaceae cyanobacterium CP_BM_ER_R8_30]